MAVDLPIWYMYNIYICFRKLDKKIGISFKSNMTLLFSPFEDFNADQTGYLPNCTTSEMRRFGGNVCVP